MDPADDSGRRISQVPSETTQTRGLIRRRGLDGLNLTFAFVFLTETCRWSGIRQHMRADLVPSRVGLRRLLGPTGARSMATSVALGAWVVAR